MFTKNEHKIPLPIAVNMKCVEEVSVREMAVGKCKDLEFVSNNI